MKPGRELDLLVAEKVMGWKRQETDNTGRYIASDVLIRPEGQLDLIPAYSGDIKAAWEVVSRLRHDWDFIITDRTAVWEVKIRASAWSEGIVLTGIGKDVPHAICEAALQTVGVEL
jgi:hypothetical protein